MFQNVKEFMTYTESKLNRLLAIKNTYPGIGWIPNVNQDAWVFDKAVKAIYDEREKAYLATLTPSELKARELQLADPKGWALAQREQAAAKSVEMYNAQKTLDKVKK